MTIRPEQVDLTDYLTATEIDNISGHIVTQIPTDYYTQGEVDNISGALDAKIPTDFYTTGEVDGISGNLNAKIPTDYYTQGEVDTISGSLDAKIPTDYYTTGEVDDISGSLQDQIVTDHGTLTGLLDDDHSVIYMNRTDIGTLSGNLVDLIPTGIADLDDVAVTTPASGQVLGYDGTTWLNSAAGGGVSDHGALTGLDDDDHSAIYYNHTDVDNISGSLLDLIPTGIAELDDVTLSSSASGEVLTYDGAAWINKTGGGGGSTTLAALTDTSISSPASGELLQWDGDDWVNGSGTGFIHLSRLTTGLSSGGGYADTTWQVISHQDPDMFSYTAGQATITVKHDGVYEISVFINMAGSPGVSYMHAVSTLGTTFNEAFVQASNNTGYGQFIWVFRLQAGNTIKIQHNSDSSASFYGVLFLKKLI